MKTGAHRPKVVDYPKAHLFLRDLLAHYKAQRNFSLRSRILQIQRKLSRGCSPALVSQVLNGKRRLTRDQLPHFSKIFKLTDYEFQRLDEGLKDSAPGVLEASSPRAPRNSILSHWSYSYVKDLVHLKSFSLSVEKIKELLNFPLSDSRIAAAIEFLLMEGFWRKTPEGKIDVDDSAVVSTHGVPNNKIRQFHQKALEYALWGIKNQGIEERSSSSVLVSIDKEKIPELRSILESFHHQLMDFVQQNPKGKDELIQITIHMNSCTRRSHE